MEIDFIVKYLTHLEFSRHTTISDVHELARDVLKAWICCLYSMVLRLSGQLDKHFGEGVNWPTLQQQLLLLLQPQPLLQLPPLQYQRLQQQNLKKIAYGHNGVNGLHVLHLVELEPNKNQDR